MANRVDFTVDDATWERFEKARGFESRASFARRALDTFLKLSELSPVPDAKGGFMKASEVRASEGRAPVEKEPSEAKPQLDRAGRPEAGSPDGSVRPAAPSRPAHNANFNRAGKLR